MKILSVEKINASDLPTLNHDKKAQRQVRKPLLEAFDIYKSNVSYGIITETLEERAEIVEWYKALCDLEPWAFTDIPTKIKKFVGIA